MKIPQSIDFAERNLLSCLMREPTLLRQIPVETTHFTREGFRSFLALLTEMEEEGAVIDEVSLAHEVEKRKLSALLGSPEDISELYWCAATPRNASSYLDILEQYRVKRRLLLASEQIKKDISEGVLTAEEILSKSLESLSMKGRSRTGEVVSVQSLAEEMSLLFEGGLPPGQSTGWEIMDEYWTIRKGEMTVLTGIPNHGKSAWLDNLLVNTMEDADFKCAVYSPENYPHSHHLARLCEIRTRKTLYKGEIYLRMSKKEMGEALNFLNKNLRFLDPGTPTIPRLLSCAEEVKKEIGLDILVLDPWNEIEHGTFEISETQYISDALGKIRRWARKQNVHVILVAHPMKLYRDRNGNVPIPTPYDISGSSHWRNKPDNCLCVWRDTENPESGTQIHIQKVRFKNTGKVGVTTLMFDRRTNRYYMP